MLARKYTRTDYFVSEMSNGDSSYFTFYKDYKVCLLLCVVVYASSFLILVLLIPRFSCLINPDW